MVCVVILSVFSISIVGSSALASEPMAAAGGADFKIGEQISQRHVEKHSRN